MSNSLMGNMLTEHVMEKAIRDKMVLQQQKQQQEEYDAYLKKKRQEDQEEFDPEFDDEELKQIMTKMKQDRIKQMEQVQAKNKNQDLGIGEYREITEEEFLPSVTKNPFTIVHFYHNDFQRCKIMDEHLRRIAPTHPECKFFSLNADKAPFFIQKLAIQMLPTLCLFIDGILKDRVVGFGELGARDDFDTITLVRRLVRAKMIQPKNKLERGFTLKKQAQGGNSDNEDDVSGDEQ